MPTYDILSPIDAGSGRRDSGTIDMDELAAREHVDLGVLALATKQAKAAAPPSKPLEEQDFPALKATAKAEKVPGYGLIRDEAKLRAAIAAHRAARAA